MQTKANVIVEPVVEVKIEKSATDCLKSAWRRVEENLAN